MRILFFLLVFGNLLFFAWAQGYFGTRDTGREPQKLDQQIQPEKLRVVARDPSAPRTPAPAPACRSITGLTLAEATALKTAMVAEAWKVTLTPVAESPELLIVITELPNKTLAEKKGGELRLLGVSEFSLAEREGGRYEIILGRFDATPDAQAFLQMLGKKNVKSARMEVRERATRKVTLTATGNAESLATQLPTLLVPYADALASACKS